MMEPSPPIAIIFSMAGCVRSLEFLARPSRCAIQMLSFFCATTKCMYSAMRLLARSISLDFSARSTVKVLLMRAKARTQSSCSRLSPMAISLVVPKPVSISSPPFVGRILDWYKAHNPQADYTADTDPGVLSVSTIYDYYKRHDYPTVVMGASFRNVGEILALAGCDRLTISPALLEELSRREGELPRRLQPRETGQARQQPLSEAEFRWQQNQDAMATEKLAEGIRNFAIDQEKLESLLQQHLS